MASRGGLPVYDRLRIKYGLSENPTSQEVDRWVRETEDNQRRGYGREDAARRAAASIFKGFETRVYASESDTIESLLDAARNR